MGLLEKGVHGTVFATVATIVVALYNGTLFAWHPILMSLGYIAAMSEGVLAAIKFRRLEGQQRVAAIQLHICVQLLATVAAAAAFAAIFRNKVINGKAHFKTTHGKFGLATLLLTAAAPLGGIVSFKKLGLLQRLPEGLHAPIKWAHRKVGIVTWLLALLTVQLALTHPSVDKGALTLFWRIAVGVLGLLLAGVAYTEPTGKPVVRSGNGGELGAQGSSGEQQLAKTL